ncbi:hypothetical protein AGRA3207_002923 [Actinomadura graeca]|uniref:Uncharacterized protein n=1 Tax=Actinomadura graeca TaxID=2750812 RepID=A0ABX8QVI1_9ACTN|nr:hypothetical protein [Actinomadura graeca]QXJ21999.1 hypothetical protein AGRA3207_002923 [Actinomadura graeca]
MAPSVGLLLLWKWAQVISFAKQVAPVLTIVSILMGGAMATLRWFIKRRRKRLGGSGGPEDGPAGEPA